ncbi:helix-turn-helix domain-containing protein [Aureimonas ureilytica]|uniref:helix-turn-helix domain-containing protein n=1 Tax=Aureimonas ureilytica TaxID=401562 RepID=UPI000A9B2E5E|nr:helix-turn-helix domain-containing protein [Aureimonas ureilytica]
MSAERDRVLSSMRTVARAFNTGTGPASDLFASLTQQNDVPHPNFLARAAIWRDHAAGLISRTEATRRSAAIGAPPTSPPRLVGAQPRDPCTPRKPKECRPRSTRPTPNESRQYAPAMATTAARDDRLTPNAKAFLQVLRARCGKSRETIITKGTAANIMARSTRTIRRYLDDLIRYGYIQSEIRTNRNGMHIGLVITVTELAVPFFESAKGLARWLAETPSAVLRPFEGVVAGFQGRTLMSPKNQTPISSLKGTTDTSRFAPRERLRSEERGKFRPFST